MGDFYTNAVRHPEDVGVGNIRRTVYFADATNAANTNGVAIGTLEAGCIPLYVHVYVPTAFDAGTTNTLNVGVVGTTAGYAAAASTLVGATGFKGNLTSTLTGVPLAADTTIYAKYGQTGTAATVGTAIVIVTFVNSRDKTGIPFPANP